MYAYIQACIHTYKFELAEGLQACHPTLRDPQRSGKTTTALKHTDTNDTDDTNDTNNTTTTNNNHNHNHNILPS